MRRLELVLLLSAVSYLLWLSFGTGLQGSAFSFLPFVCAGVALLQVSLEGYRWHVIPAYGLAVLEILSYKWCYAHHFRLRLTEMALMWMIAGVAVLAVGWFAGVLYPVFAFVPVMGKHRVGTFAMPLQDTGRMDPYAPGKPVPRELMLQLWYPCEAKGLARRARYRDGRKDDWRSSNLALVKTRALLNAPLAQQVRKLPVILFIGPNNRFQNTFQTEELASHGYLVVAIDHPYDSDRVLFPDGRIISRRKENVFLDFRTEQTLGDSTREVVADLGVRVADVEHVIERLREWDLPDSASPLSCRLDTSRFGILGHSFGGAVGAEACVRNPEIRAGINMDGWLFGDAQANGVPQPFFFMADCTPRPGTAELNLSDAEERRRTQRTLQGYEEVERSLALHGGYFLQPLGMEHMNYTDYPLFSQVKARTGAGLIDIYRAHSMINELSVAFFNTYLRDAPEDVLVSTASKFPEATFRRYEQPGTRQCPAYQESAATP